MPVSARHRGWFWDAANSRLSVYVDGTEIARFDDATADLTLLTNGLSTAGGVVVTGGVSRYNDDLVLQLGTDGDVALVERSTSLSANTALTNVLAGTPVSAATPANSLLVSNITVDGDIAFFALLGGTNSTEVFRIDTSAGLVVFNEASADWDFRIEGNGDANLFNLDGGLDAIGIGAVADADVKLRVGGVTVTRLTTANVTTAGNVTYTAAQLLGGRITRDPNGAGRTDTTDTAANIVAAIASAAVGDTFDTIVENTADAAEAITLAAGTGVTLERLDGTGATIAQNGSAILRTVLTNVTASSEAVSIYVIAS